MKQNARAVLVDGQWMAEVVRSEACAACRACDFGKTEVVRMPLPKGDYVEGQPVEISLPDGRVGVASLWGYGLPLACMLLGLWLGGVLFHTDAARIVGALAFLAASFLILRLLEPKFKKSGAYRPRACAMTTREDKTDG